MVEQDDGCNFSCEDYMGYVEHVLGSRQLGLGIDIQPRRAVKDNGDKGDFSITYEIRPVPMSDLEPLTIRVDEPGGSVKRVCMTVVNSGPVHAGAFEVTLRVDGQLPPGGRYPVSGLTSGSNYRACVPTTLLTSGKHKLAMTIDEKHAIREYNETNNYLELPYTGTSGKAGVPGQGNGQADLTVSAVKVNGQAPDGKDDCKDGKNVVTVVVKNGGAATADVFTTRLTVDDVDVAEQSAIALEAGKETEVRFEGVQLKKGEHKLTARADVNSQVAEADEGNNALTVTARC